MICEKTVHIKHMLDSSLKWRAIGVLQQNSPTVYLMLENLGHIVEYSLLVPHKPEDVSCLFAWKKSPTWVLAHPLEGVICWVGR